MVRMLEDAASMCRGVVGLLAALLIGPAVAPTPSGGVDPSGRVDLVPVLTSAPFGALGGQAVTHTVVVSGTGAGTITAVRLTFTTTAELDGVAANASQGGCTVVNALTVACDLGTLVIPGADATPPKVTITGRVKPGIARGSLVRNLVTVTSESPDADASNNAPSNAYLIPGSTSGGPRAAPAASDPTPRPKYLIPVAATVLALGVLAGLIVLRRRRSP